MSSAFVAFDGPLRVAHSIGVLAPQRRPCSRRANVMAQELLPEDLFALIAPYVRLNIVPTRLSLRILNENLCP